MSRRILVLAFALEEVRHRLEAPMGMVWRADSLLGPVSDRPHLIQEEKWVHHGQAGGGVGPTDDETAALSLPLGGDDAGDIAVLSHP